MINILHVKAEWVDITCTSLGDKSVFSPVLLDINWSAIYPFAEESSYEQCKVLGTANVSGGGGAVGTAGGYVSRPESLVDKIYGLFEKYSSDWFMLTDSCEILSKGFNYMLGCGLIADSYGSLVFQQADGRFMAERPGKSVAEEEATNVVLFAKYLESEGIVFLCCNTIPNGPVFWRRCCCKGIQRV